MTGRYTAHHEVRQSLGCVIGITGFGAIGAIGAAIYFLPRLEGWAFLLLGIDLFAVVVGIWYAKEWARWASGIISAVYCLGGLSMVVEAVLTRDPLRAAGGLVKLALGGVLTWYSFHPSTREQFARAREIIARSRSGRIC